MLRAYRSPWIPTPPATCRAPVNVLVALVMFVICTIPAIVAACNCAVPPTFNVAPTYKLLPTAAPPATCNAPLCVLIEFVVADIEMPELFVNTVPLNPNVALVPPLVFLKLIFGRPLVTSSPCRIMLPLLPTVR